MLAWLALLWLAACGDDGAAVGADPAPPPPVEDPADPPSPEAPAPAAPAGPSCEERLGTSNRAIAEATPETSACRWDGDCALVDTTTGCAAACPVAMSREAGPAVGEAVRRQDEGPCDGFVEAGCERPERQCSPMRAICRDDVCASVPAPPDETLQERWSVGRPYPPGNSPRLTEAPPRPPADARLEADARRLFEAIKHDDPSLAEGFFMPRDGFVVMKGIEDSGAYWDRLFRTYQQDVHALHESLADLDRAEFERFELVRRGGWVTVREEGNRLPYWASRHCWLYYRVGEEVRRFEVRVLITWDERWYLAHLNEFH